ncbi:MAG: hypothetical protein ACI9V8_002226 [Urechidicola sp.]|jgi:hypothetical protein
MQIGSHHDKPLKQKNIPLFICQVGDTQLCNCENNMKHNLLRWYLLTKIATLKRLKQVTWIIQPENKNSP